MQKLKGGRSSDTAKGLGELKRLHKEAQARARLAEDAERAARHRSAKTPPGSSLPGRPGRPGPSNAPDDGDTDLFRRAVKAVMPIKDTRRAVLPPTPADSDDVLRGRRAAAMGNEPPHTAQVSDHYRPAHVHHDDACFLRPGHGPDVLKGLRTGKWPTGATLDLHGNTLDEARERLDRFIQSCVEHQIRCVRIVHGKGYGSKDGEPVLKQTIRRWLTQIEAVSAYAECSERDGGAGAVQVLLQAHSS
jgi:DNA-nicking Smr family endonuclease